MAIYPSNKNTGTHCFAECCDDNDDLMAKIKSRFSEAMYGKFNERRYGIKNCINNEDPFYLQDVMEIYKRALELKNDCPTSKELDTCCSFNVIEETIKTL